MLKHNNIYGKILNAQELGYRNSKPRQAGRYIYISKMLIGFFPPLSDSIKNDHVILNIIPDDSPSVVFTNFVYHNDKVSENNPNGRDEYRLYLNEGNDPEGEYYEPGDIVLLQNVVTEGSVLYKLNKISKKGNSSKYKQVEDLIEKYSEVPGTKTALIPQGKLAFLKLQDSVKIDTSKTILTEDIKETVFAEPIILSTPQENEFTRRVRNTSFRDFVLLFYDYKCAITGKKNIIEYENLVNLEAAHIHAFAHNGSDNPANGLPLTRDLHWAFDNGFITITGEYKVMVHEKAENSELLQGINGRNLLLPEDYRSLPNLESIKWHNKNVFGSFIRKVTLK